MGLIAPDVNLFPAALPQDGALDLVSTDNSHGAIKGIKMLHDVTTGAFFDSSRVRYHKVEAYRITPLNQDNGYISVDGERVPFEPFQVEVHRGLGRVVARQPHAFESKGPRRWRD